MPAETAREYSGRLRLRAERVFAAVTQELNVLRRLSAPRRIESRKEAFPLRHELSGDVAYPERTAEHEELKGARQGAAVLPFGYRLIGDVHPVDLERFSKLRLRKTELTPPLTQLFTYIHNATPHFQL